MTDSASSRPDSAAAEPTTASGKIRHVFVLILENRSFDHLFGLADVQGVVPPDGSFGFKPGAADSLRRDPPHEFDDVQAQLAQGAMTGFAQHSGADAMQGFGPGMNRVLEAVARAGILFDNWFSSVPGPTWPNRFFAHAASSGGLANSPRGIDVAQAVNSGLYAYHFEHGHVFDRLAQQGRSWRVYRGDTFPQVLALEGMVESRLDRQRFRRMGEFAADLRAPYAVDYTFVEPDYDTFGGFAHGNSQHPLGSVSAGERLVGAVYDAVFGSSSTVAQDAALLVTWDEHGGFFDHVAPPAAPAPGDVPLNQQRAAQPRDFAFDRLGVRVPTLLVSPGCRRAWAPACIPAECSTMRPSRPPCACSSGSGRR